MRTEIAASTLHLRIETSKELYQLVPEHMRMPITKGTSNLPPEKKSLSSKLHMCGEGELPGNATLSFVPDTRNIDGIDVKFFPKGELSWSKLKTISVEVAYRLYEQLAIQGLIAACYAGDSEVRIKFGL